MGSPNVVKIYLALEEMGLPYRVHPVDVFAEQQFSPEFLRLNPNAKVPVIVDPEGPGGKPYTCFESGAILLYLAEKSGTFLPKDLRGRVEVTQWLFWQVGGLGPMAGQNHHFSRHAPEKLPYAIERYVNETNRLYGVLNKRLAEREFIAGTYSIADMAAYPWIVPYEAQGQNLSDFPHLKRWFEAIKSRPATLRAYERGAAVNPNPTVNEESRKILFGQTAKTIGNA
jgi:GST-like protein